MTDDTGIQKKKALLAQLLGLWGENGALHPDGDIAKSWPRIVEACQLLERKAKLKNPDYRSALWPENIGLGKPRDFFSQAHALLNQLGEARRLPNGHHRIAIKVLVSPDDSIDTRPVLGVIKRVAESDDLDVSAGVVEAARALMPKMRALVSTFPAPQQMLDMLSIRSASPPLPNQPDIAAASVKYGR